MGFIEKEDVKGLLEDDNLMNDIVEAILENPTVADEIVSEVVDEISDDLEDDVNFRNKLIGAATKKQILQKKVINELIKDLS